MFGQKLKLLRKVSAGCDLIASVGCAKRIEDKILICKRHENKKTWTTVAMYLVGFHHKYFFVSY